MRVSPVHPVIDYEASILGKIPLDLNFSGSRILEFFMSISQLK